MRKVLVLAVLVVLGGCASAEQRAARRDAILDNFATICEKIGYARGTEQNKSCVLDLVKADMAGEPARAAASSAAAAAAAANRPRTCTQLGAHVSCN